MAISLRYLAYAQQIRATCSMGYGAKSAVEHSGIRPRQNPSSSDGVAVPSIHVLEFLPVCGIVESHRTMNDPGSFEPSIPIHSRRHFLAQQGIAGATLWIAGLAANQANGEPPKPTLQPVHYDLKAKPSHFAPQAKAMISMFMQGGPSHMDLFDRKIELEKRNGENYSGELKYDNAAESSAKIWAGPWKWERQIGRAHV